MCRERISQNSAKEFFAILDEKPVSDKELRALLVAELTRIISKLIDEKVAFNNQ
jgi:beta-mannanase